jgi:hypothetical protein
MKKLMEDLRPYEAVYRLEYKRNRFIQICRVIKTKTIGFATLLAMEWAKQENMVLQDVVEENVELGLWALGKMSWKREGSWVMVFWIDRSCGLIVEEEQTADSRVKYFRILDKVSAKHIIDRHERMKGKEFEVQQGRSEAEEV